MIDEAPHEQARRLIRDSADTLGCSYAEVSGVPELSSIFTGYEFLPPDASLAQRAAGANLPFVIEDTQDDSIANELPVARLHLRSVAFWPVAHEHGSATLILGWTVPRSGSLTEAEMKYVDFLAGLISRLINASQRQKALAEQIERDSLTGLLNRTAIIEHISNVLSSTQRSGTNAAVLYIDLDQFKAINDTYGHAIGDATLGEIGRRMKSVLRKHEAAGRMGGDEFAVVVSSYTDESEVEGVAVRLVKALSAPIVSKSVCIQASASIGIATAPRNATTVTELLVCADHAMYEAKRTHRPFAFYGAQRPAVVRTLHAEDQSAHKPASDAPLILCVQPVVDARTRRPIGGEVLARWLDPQLGVVLPERMLRGASESHDLIRLETLILQSAARHALAFAGSHWPLPFYVNVWRPDEPLLEAGSSAAPLLALEFDEQHIAQDADRFVPFIAACSERGYRVGVSNFGGGDLPLRTLAQMDFDFVKIHARQIREHSWNGRTGKTLRTLIDHAHNLSCTVIAEAVEDSAEADVLLSCGVDALQGFSICSPLTERDFATWIHYRAAAS